MMRSGLKIDRLFGIDVYIDWSWLLVFLLVTWDLAAAVFPSLHPNWGLDLNIAMGVLASLVFFFSILLHELAHSIVARARGLPVRRITLFFFGGVSNIQREPPSPGTEFFMAVVGPLTSIVLGVIFLVLGVGQIPRLSFVPSNATPLLRSLSPLATMLVWLGPVNIIIGLFNLIPAFPLDGGRILRSILWALSHNLRRATRWATAVGQAFGWLMIVAGIAMVFGASFPILGSGFINGLWLAFIGWFVISAAVQSYHQVVIEDLLQGVPVTSLMREPAPAVSPDMTVHDLVFDHVMRGEERAFPVMDGGRLAGMVYAEDLRKVDRNKWDRTRVRDVMVPESDLDELSPREDAMDAFQKMASKEMRQMPVVQNGQLIGVLRRRDILRWLQVQSDAGSGD